MQNMSVSPLSGLVAWAWMPMNAGELMRPALHSLAPADSGTSVSARQFMSRSSVFVILSNIGSFLIFSY